MGEVPAGRRPAIQLCRLGMLPYGEALAMQRRLVERRRTGEVPDQLVLLEHPHVISLGTGARAEHLLDDPDVLRERGIEVHRSDRGGDITYHGPGQLIGYPILNLNPDRRDLHRYLRDLEEVLIRVVADFDIDGFRADGLTGVWTERGKIAAIGVRVSSGWITSHGFALNVATDLRQFETIVPCGLNDRAVTSLASLLGSPPALEEVAARAAHHFADVFERELESTPP